MSRRPSLSPLGTRRGLLLVGGAICFAMLVSTEVRSHHAYLAHRIARAHVGLLIPILALLLSRGTEETRRCLEQRARFGDNRRILTLHALLRQALVTGTASALLLGVAALSLGITRISSSVLLTLTAFLAGTGYVLWCAAGQRLLPFRGGAILALVLDWLLGRGHGPAAQGTLRGQLRALSVDEQLLSAASIGASCASILALLALLVAIILVRERP